MNPFRFGMLTLGSDWASITSSPRSRNSGSGGGAGHASHERALEENAPAQEAVASDMFAERRLFLELAHGGFLPVLAALRRTDIERSQ
jgi:hypothetical protein